MNQSDRSNIGAVVFLFLKKPCFVNNDLHFAFVLGSFLSFFNINHRKNMSYISEKFPKTGDKSLSRRKYF